MGAHLESSQKLKSIGSHVTLQANRGLGYVLEESV